MAESAETMLIENAPVAGFFSARQARFLIKFFKHINPIEILGKKGLQSEAKIHYLECTSEGELNDEELQKGINERTCLVAVAQASADIMLGMIIGKTKDEALRLGNLFLRMIKGEASDEEIDELEEAGALKDISHMPARVKCAVLGWHTLEEAFKQEK